MENAKNNNIYDFKINYLKLDNLEIIVDKKFEKNESIFISVLIGENGVGKSNILSSIEEIFTNIDLYLDTGRMAPLKYAKSYEVEYSINGIKYKVEYGLVEKKSSLKFWVNNEDMEIHNIEPYQRRSIFKIPSKVLCCAFQVNDKFRFRKDEEGIFKYLGVKTTPTMTNLSSVTKRISNNILECVYKKKYIDLLINCFDFLQLEKNIHITYKMKYKKIFFDDNDPITINNIVEKIENQLWKGRSRFSAFGKGMFEEIKLNNDILKRVVKQINNIADKYGNRNEIELEIKLEETDTDFKSFFDREALEILMKLDIISNPSITVKKKGYYHLQNGSSGETHILFLITNILNNIDEGSLILIDEPEVSLHPSWQIRIVELIRDMLKATKKTCHLLVASHSHFIVSDLQPNHSSLHVLKKNRIEGISECENIDNDTYGWSAENILLNVFGVPTNRNYYLGKKLDDLLYKVSKGDIDCVLEEKENLENLSEQLLDSDPLKIVISKIISRAENIKVIPTKFTKDSNDKNDK